MHSKKETCSQQQLGKLLMCKRDVSLWFPGSIHFSAPCRVQWELSCISCREKLMERLGNRRPPLCDKGMLAELQVEMLLHCGGYGRRWATNGLQSLKASLYCSSCQSFSCPRPLIYCSSITFYAPLPEDPFPWESNGAPKVFIREKCLIDFKR